MFNLIKATKAKEEKKNLSIENKSNKFSFWVLLGLVFLLPLFIIPISSVPLLLSKATLIYFATFILSFKWLFDRLRDGRFITSKSPIVILGILIPGIYFISALFSGSIMTSFVGQGTEVGISAFVISLFLLMFLSLPLLKTAERIYYLFLSFFASFFLISVFQVLRLFLGVDFMSFGVLTSPFSNLLGSWNELAIFYGLTSVLSLTVIEFVNHSKILKIISFVILVTSLFFVALINFTTVWIVLGVFSFIIVSSIVSSNRFSKEIPDSRGKRFPIFSFVVILISLIFILGPSGIGTGLSSHFKIQNTEARLSVRATFNIAKDALETKAFLLGVGPNRFINQWLISKPVSINNTVFWNTDFNTGFSFIFSSLITVGFLGFVSWLLLFSFLLVVGFKSVFSPTKDKAKDYLLPLSYLTTIYLWLFMIIYTPTVTLMGLTFLFTGSLVSLLIQNGSIKIKSVSFSENRKIDFIFVLISIFLILVLIAGTFVVFSKLISTVYIQRGVQELNKKNADLDKGESYIAQSIKLLKSDTAYRILSEINVVKSKKLLADKNISKSKLITQAQKTLTKAALSAKTAVSLNPTNYQNWLSLGRAIMLTGNKNAYEQVLPIYSNATHLNPKSPSIFFELGLLEFGNKDYKNAVNAFERSVILKSNYSNARYYLGLTYYYLGKKKEALLQFENVKLLNPNVSKIDEIIKNIKRGASLFGESKSTTASNKR